MAVYLVSGANKETGKERILKVRALTIEQANRKAQDRGFLISSVEKRESRLLTNPVDTIARGILLAALFPLLVAIVLAVCVYFLGSWRSTSDKGELKERQKDGLLRVPQAISPKGFK